MQETMIERNMMNITEVIDFQTAELVLKELEIVLTEIEEALNREYKGEKYENKSY